MPLSPSVDGVATALANDAQILAFKGLTTSSPVSSIAAYILKTEETDDVVTSATIPLLLIYTRPGSPDHTTKQQYNDKIVVDTYASDAYHTRQMADRVFDVLHNATLPSPTFQVSACRFAFGSSFKTTVSGVRGYRLWFDVSYFIG